MNTSSSARLILRNLGSLTTGRVIADLFTFVLFVTLSRRFGGEGIGRYSFAMALTGFFAVAADYGMYTYSVKHLSRKDGDLGGHYGAILSLRLMFSAVALLVLVAVALVLPFPHETRVIVLLIGVFQIGFTLLNGFAAVFVASEEMHLAALLEVVTRLVTAVAGVAIVLAGGGLVTAVATMPAVTLVGAVVGYGLLRRRHGVPRLRPPGRELRSQLGEIAPFGVASFMRQASTRLDVLLLGFILGEVAAGTYNVAYRLIFPLLFLPHFVGIVLFPSASRMYETMRDKLGERYRRSINLIVLAGLPAAAGLWLIAEDLILVVYGEGFAESVTVLRWLSWLLLISLVKGVLGVFLMSCDRERLWTRGWTISACVNLVGNLVLIPTVGILGAAIATLAAEMSLLVLALFWLRPVLGWPLQVSRLLIGAAGSAAFCIVFTRWVHAPWFMVIPGSIAIYAAVVLAFPQVRGTELRLARELIGER